MKKIDPNEFPVLGMMSGTSLDGLDLAVCTFEKKENTWEYNVHSSETIEYPLEWRKRLIEVEKSSALEFAIVHKQYGHLLGKMASSFIKDKKIKPKLIASHGHTIFHQPEIGLTFQIGDGAAIASETRLPVVCDFRSNDVALGGQGAPLVPVGDQLLFGDYRYCLNLGGFCNISYTSGNQRLAFDISPCNMVLNHYSAKLNLPFDINGEIASRGKCYKILLEKLNSIDYYNRQPPKSLGKEWVDKEFIPLLSSYPIAIEDTLSTLVEHISDQVAFACSGPAVAKILLTGGGAHNSYLVSRIQKKVQHQVIVPDTRTVDFKEALVFAFLGLLRYKEEINVLRSVTGGKTDHSAGSVYLAP